ncbi:LacI family DNA-binding transcriptional regulator [Nitriliruptoraceae bacterium ZYF776]|nr:LacI family DNA-binding transcriptional regulator [Profundirhabdus halotolerans]
MGDVAALAGVSQMTVSRVVNGRPGVRDETRTRVLAAMRELGYQPNSAARALVTGRSRALGVVSFDGTLHGPAATLAGIELEARQAGYRVIVTSMPQLDRPSVVGAIERLRAQGVEGVIVIPPHATALVGLRRLVPDVPLVAVEADPDDVAPVVVGEQEIGAARATRHLLDLGHRTVWHVAGPDDWLEARRRTAGWRAVLHAAGIDAPPPLPGDWSARSGYHHGRALASDPQVTAVFAANDQMALGVLRALFEAGRDVPGQVSLVGFDDIPEAAYFTPPMTTVRQDFRGVGRRSVAALLDQVQGRTPPALATVLDCDLVLRGSSGAAPVPP